MFLELQADAGDYRDVRGARRAPRPGADRRLIIRTLSRLLFAAYFLEAGFILRRRAVVGRSGSTTASPRRGRRSKRLLQSPYARGGVTGVGVITALAGLAELGSVILVARRAARDPGPDSAP